MSDDAPNPLIKKCGQVKRESVGNLTVTTYKTFAVKTAEWKNYDWHFQANKTIVTLVEPQPFKKDDMLLLVKTYNQLNKVSSYDLFTLDEQHICSFGRDTELVQRNVHMDKKWNS